MSFLLSFAAGVPFLITAELFKQSHRPAAYTVAGCLNWLSNFTIGFVFPFLEVRANSYSTINCVHMKCNSNAPQSFSVHVCNCWLANLVPEMTKNMCAHLVGA